MDIPFQRFHASVAVGRFIGMGGYEDSPNDIELEGGIGTGSLAIRVWTLSAHAMRQCRLTVKHSS